MAFQLGLVIPGQRPSQKKDGFLSVVGVFLDAGLVPLIVRTQAVADHRFYLLVVCLTTQLFRPSIRPSSSSSWR